MDFGAKIPDEEIKNHVNSASGPSMACHNLIKAANDAGGPDNISAILIQFLD